jgi:hypothetical protein
MCLWNGFMAAAPGHPYLAKAIETVVNQVRNRFTSVDVDEKFCHNPKTSNPEPSILETSVLHDADTLFITGPCLLGASINQVHQRNLRTQFEAGDVQMPSREAADDGNDPAMNIPGRTVILHQNKQDMGAHRFTRLDLNLLVVVTDMPRSDDLTSKKATNVTKVHYSKTHVQAGTYGLSTKTYQNQKQANEDILIKVIG